MAPGKWGGIAQLLGDAKAGAVSGGGVGKSVVVSAEDDKSNEPESLGEQPSFSSKNPFIASASRRAAINSNSSSLLSVVSLASSLGVNSGSLGVPASPSSPRGSARRVSGALVSGELGAHARRGSSNATDEDPDKSSGSARAHSGRLGKTLSEGLSSPASRRSAVRDLGSQLQQSLRMDSSGLSAGNVFVLQAMTKSQQTDSDSDSDDEDDDEDDDFDLKIGEMSGYLESPQGSTLKGRRESRIGISLGFGQPAPDATEAPAEESQSPRTLSRNESLAMQEQWSEKPQKHAKNHMEPAGDTTDASFLALRNAKTIEHLIQEAGDEQARCHEKWLRRRQKVAPQQARHEHRLSIVGKASEDFCENVARKTAQKLRRKRRTCIMSRLSGAAHAYADDVGDRRQTLVARGSISPARVGLLQRKSVADVFSRLGQHTRSPGAAGSDDGSGAAGNDDGLGDQRPSSVVTPRGSTVPAADQRQVSDVMSKLGQPAAPSALAGAADSDPGMGKKSLLGAIPHHLFAVHEKSESGSQKPSLAPLSLLEDVSGSQTEQCASPLPIGFAASKPDVPATTTLSTLSTLLHGALDSGQSVGGEKTNLPEKRDKPAVSLASGSPFDNDSPQQLHFGYAGSEPLSVKLPVHSESPRKKSFRFANTDGLANVEELELPSTADTENSRHLSSDGPSFLEETMSPFKRRRLPEIPRLRNKFRDRRYILSDNWRKEAGTTKRLHLEVARRLGLDENDWTPWGCIYNVDAKKLLRAAEQKEEDHRNAAATKMQRKWRSMRLYRSTIRLRAERRRAMRKIQRWWRVLMRWLMPMRKRVQERPMRMAAVTRIQAMVRGAILRRRMVCKKDLHSVVWRMTCLNKELGGQEIDKIFQMQALVRGFLGRRRVRALVLERKLAKDAQEERDRLWALKNSGRMSFITVPGAANEGTRGIVRAAKRGSLPQVGQSNCESYDSSLERPSGRHKTMPVSVSAVKQSDSEDSASDAETPTSEVAHVRMNPKVYRVENRIKEVPSMSAQLKMPLSAGVGRMGGLLRRYHDIATEAPKEVLEKPVNREIKYGSFVVRAPPPVAQDEEPFPDGKVAYTISLKKPPKRPQHFINHKARARRA